jgi:hypothetical protein
MFIIRFTLPYDPNHLHCLEIKIITSIHVFLISTSHQSGLYMYITVDPLYFEPFCYASFALYWPNTKRMDGKLKGCKRKHPQLQENFVGRRWLYQLAKYWRLKLGIYSQMIWCQVHTRQIKRTPNEVHDKKNNLKWRQIKGIYSTQNKLTFTQFLFGNFHSYLQVHG